MTLVDSSGWVEYFENGSLADRFAPYLEDLTRVLTPTVVLYEVYRKIKRDASEEMALVAVAQMQKTRIVPLTEPIALRAADLGLEHGLALADSIVYATATIENARLVTSDSDLGEIPGVIYFPKKK